MTRTHCIILAILAALCFTGCPSWTPQKKAAVSAALESAALNALGRVAVAELQSLAAGDGDFAHAAASAVWTTGTVGDIFDAVRAAGASPALASRAQDVATAAVNGGIDSRTAINAVASAISAGASK